MPTTREEYKENVETIDPLPTGNASDFIMDNFLAIADNLEAKTTQIDIVASAVNWLSETSHSALSLGASTNGLSLAGQQLQLATATTSTAGAMSATDKTKLDNYATYPPYTTVCGKTIITGNNTVQVGATFTIPANRLTTADFIRVRVNTGIGSAGAGEYGIRYRFDGGSWLSNVGRAASGANTQIFLDMTRESGTAWVAIFGRYPSGGSSPGTHQGNVTITTPSDSHTIEIGFTTPTTFSETIYHGTLEIIKG